MTKRDAVHLIAGAALGSLFTFAQMPEAAWQIGLALVATVFWVVVAYELIGWSRERLAENRVKVPRG